MMCMLLVTLVSFGQNVFDNGNSTGLWSDNDNWDTGVKPVSTDLVQTSDVATNVVDEDFTIKNLIITSGSVTINPDAGTENITIDVNTTFTSATNNNTSTVSFESTGTNTLNMDVNITVLNSAAGRSYIKNQVATNTFNLTGDVALEGDVYIDNDGTMDLSGTFTQDGTNRSINLDGSGTTSFETGFDANAVQNLKLFNNGVVLHVNAGSNGNPVFDGVVTSQSATSEGNRKTFTMEFNNEDGFSLLRHQCFNYSTTNMTFNESMNDYGELRLFEETIVNITVASGKHAYFDASNGTAWKATSALNITGYDFSGANPSNIKFGSGDGALLADQLSAITLVGGADAGEEVALDANGYLVLASTVGVKDINAFDFAIYPNPVIDELTITTNETIESVQVLDLVGKTVISTSVVNGSVNVSSLKSGIYVVKVNSSNGAATSKFVKK